ncbi:MAG: winged helix-turn-helix domain-containing tetratricopeptide repeat protein [Terriglobales bacterium]
MVSLERAPLELLLLLASRAGQLVTRQEAAARLWAPGVFVSTDAGLYTAIKKLRQALGESATAPRWIRTVARKGYQFAGAVESGAPGGDRPIVAVLPFASYDERPDRAYFAAGLTEELITHLGRAGGRELGVLARTTMMHYRDSRLGVGAIGRELGATYLIEGSVRTGRGRARVAVQLIRVADETHVWAAHYERPLGDQLRAQQETAAAAARVILERLTPPARAPREPGGMTAESQDLLLRARFFWEQRTQATLWAARRYFAQALARDGACAAAWAGLAFCHALAPFTGDGCPRECFAAAGRAAARALALDARCGETHVARGIVHFWFDRNWEAAEASLRRALELNPSDARARMYVAHLLSILGRHAEAAAEIEAARALDPLSPIINTHAAQFLYHAGQQKQALAALERAIELAPRFWVARVVKGKVLGAVGELGAALAEFRRAAAEAPGSSEPMALAGYTLARLGRRRAARQILIRLQARGRRRFVPPLSRALVLLGLGETKRALDELEAGLCAADVRLAFLGVEPRWDELREQPRFQRLMRQLRLGGARAARN